MTVAIDALHEPDRAEVQGLTDLIERTAAHDRHRPVGEHALVELKQGPQAMPHAAFVARVDGQPVGYAHLSERETRRGWPLEAFVAPEHRGAGTGEALVRAVLEHVSAHGGGLIHAWAYRPGPAQERLAERFGMHIFRRLFRMARPLPGPDVPPPSGVRLQSFRNGDAAAWLALHNRVFAEHPDAGDWRDVDLRWRLREPGFDPEGFVLAEDPGGLVGYCWMRVEDTDGWVYFLGADPRARGTGLSDALCSRGMAWATMRGADRCLLYVDGDNEPAIRLYRRLGFEMDHVDHCYELAVEGTPEGPPTPGAVEGAADVDGR